MTNTLRIEKIAQSRRGSLTYTEENIGFGKYFTDHMFEMSYETGKGWHDPRIVPYHPLQLDPSAMVLHYAQEVFEGLKAYKGKGEGIYLFRYKDNLQRFNRSCERMVIPTIDCEFVGACLKQLIHVDQTWMPAFKGSSLYIRPTVIATTPALGVRPADHFLFYIILSPVGAYYHGGFKPISIFVSENKFRAVNGGVGEAKTGGNYAASLLSQIEARDLGFTQVLWLDAIHHKYVEEVGTMNIFFKIGEEVITSPLTGSILPGLTRDSVIKLLKFWGVPVCERLISIDELISAQMSGHLQEVFGTGTAAVITSVNKMSYKGENYPLGHYLDNVGPLSKKLYDSLLAIQCGYESNPFQWSERIV